VYCPYIENELPWFLDVAFNEDKCKIKDKNATANFAATRRFALGFNEKC
jgi:predicted transposase YbfD/YdcC